MPKRSMLRGFHHCLPFFCLVLTLLTPLLVRSNPTNVPLGYTGGFKEANCTYCHAGQPNPASGSAAILAPAMHTASGVFTISVTVRDTAANRTRWGFELSARFSNGKQAGTFAARPGIGVRTSASTGIQYAMHDPAPSAAAGGYTFSVDWTAPSDLSNGDVSFSASAIAADGKGSGGDDVFTAEVTSHAALSPVINAGGIVSSANFQVSGGLAPGSLVSIFGEHLAASAVAASSLPLPFDLNGTRVYIGGIPMPLLYVSPTQINAQVPSTLPPGHSAAVVVEVNVSLRNQITPEVLLDAFAPSFFSLDGTGKGAVAALHAADFSGDLTQVNAASPARPGEIVALYCTGLGQTAPLMEDGNAPSGLHWTLYMPSVTIGGKDAKVDFSGAAPFCVGAYQVNVFVPEVDAGDHDLVLTIGGKSSPAGITIRVEPRPSSVTAIPIPRPADR